MSPNRSRSPGPAPPAARGALPFPGASFVAEPRGRGGGVVDAPISKARPPPRAGSLSPPLISLLRRLFSWQSFLPPRKAEGARLQPGAEAMLRCPPPHLSLPRQPPTNRSPQ